MPRYHGFGRRPAACINCLIASGDSTGFAVVAVGVVGIALPVAVTFPSTRL
jgi:hypothetical protein